MNRYICIHGHFYQPPRENPWLEDVEMQDSAYPYHDWNERVTAECYRQNADSRILGADKKIVEIVNNYAKISLNFGPTLLYWLQEHAPDVYEKVLLADKISRERFSGHGCALAQAYNHIILPLANARDKHTQIIWAVRDFQRRFQREPEGMWLPETAVDIPTLEALVEHGIKFTILAPRQAQRVREIGAKKWRQVSENELDTTVPYICNLPSGKQIALFFFNGSISYDIAYGELLQNGKDFADRLIGAFPGSTDKPRLVHIASDGESYGHHHRFADMALAYCLHTIETNKLAQVTIYAEYLEKFPPNQEVEIWENTSWSCDHGVGRWRNNCGCAANLSYSSQQQWRAPLREAVDWLRDKLTSIYQERMAQYCSDPWQARNEYINVIHDRSLENVEKFISHTTGKELTHEDKVKFLKLLEMQCNALLMYTSCGWFFDHIWGIETVQVMQYAARAMQLCRDVQKSDFEPEFKNSLARAPSSKKKYPTGKDVYEAFVEPAKIDLDRVAAHFALCTIFEPGKSRQDPVDIYSYSVTVDDSDRAEAGMQVLTTARATIRSKITLETAALDMVALYLGEQNLFAALGPRTAEQDFNQTRAKLAGSFRKGDTNEVIRLMNVYFDGRNYSILHLFKDPQRRILNELLANTREEIESSFRHIYEHNYAIMQMIRGMNMPLPKALSVLAEFVVNEDLRRVIQADEIDISRLRNLTDEAVQFSLELDRERLKFEGGLKINRLMSQLNESPGNGDLLRAIERTLEILKILTPDMDLQNAQNIFFTVAKERKPEMKNKADAGDPQAQKWLEHFKNLANHLGLAVP